MVLDFFYVNRKIAKAIVTPNNLLNKDDNFFLSERVINSKEGFYLGRNGFRTSLSLSIDSVYG